MSGCPRSSRHAGSRSCPAPALRRNPATLLKRRGRYTVEGSSAWEPPPLTDTHTKECASELPRAHEGRVEEGAACGRSLTKCGQGLASGNHPALEHLV